MGGTKKTGKAKGESKTAKSSSPSKDIKKDFSKMFAAKPAFPKKTMAVNSVIKFAFLNGYVGAHILNLKKIGKSPYTEKVLHDYHSRASRGEENFLSEYNPVSNTDKGFFWHHGDIKQKHSESSDWHVRYFLFRIEFLPTIEMEEKLEFIRMLANLISAEVNSQQRIGSPVLTVPLDDEDLIYAPREEMVLSDVIGRDDASRLIRLQLGNNYAAPFEENKDFIFQFFRSGEVPERLRAYLSAPEEEIWIGN